MTEGEQGDDVYVIRSGSMVVEKDIGGKPIFLRYLPAGSYFGEMGVLSGEPRNATVKAAVGSEVIKLTGESFRKMLAARPQVRAATEAQRERLLALRAEGRIGDAAFQRIEEELDWAELGWAQLFRPES